MWSASLISGGAETDLSDNINYLLTGLDGIGMSPSNRIQQQGPEQHGASDVGYRLQPRKIALGLLALGGTDTAWLTRRNTLLSLFRSADTALNFKIKSTDGSIIRQIDCFFSGEMSMAVDPDLRQGWQPVAVELLAPDPTWYDPSGQSLVFGVAAGGQAMDVPLAVPWQVGASTVNTSTSLAYPGTWDSYPIVTIVGPITDPVVTNATMGDKLDFTGLSLGAGAQRVIDCRYGYKTVVDASGVNKVSDLTSDSNLATFRIGAHPNPLNGDNTFTVTGTAANAATQVTIQYYVRYIGV